MNETHITTSKPVYIAATPRCRVCGCELAHEPGLGGLPDLCVSCWAKQGGYSVISKAATHLVLQVNR
jgi:hypothetical protein